MDSPRSFFSFFIPMASFHLHLFHSSSAKAVSASYFGLKTVSTYSGFVRLGSQLSGLLRSLLSGRAVFSAASSASEIVAVAPYSTVLSTIFWPSGPANVAVTCVSASVSV